MKIKDLILKTKPNEKTYDTSGAIKYVDNLIKELDTIKDYFFWVIDTYNMSPYLKDVINNYDNTKEIIAFMHYPPLVKQQLLENNHLEFYKVLKKYDIKRCYYGHLHGNSIYDAVEGKIQGIELKLVSADGLDFKLIKI